MAAKRVGKESILLYVNADLKQDLKKYALADNRSLTNFIVCLLEEYRKSHPLISEEKERVSCYDK